MSTVHTPAMISVATTTLTGHSDSDINCNKTSLPLPASAHGPKPTPTPEPVQQWQGTIRFPLYILDHKTKDEDIPSIFHKPPRNLDICQYLNGQSIKTKRLYFCPKTYPPPCNDEEMENHISKRCLSWIKLKNDLFVRARDAGNPVVSNGRRDKKGTTRAIKCGYCHTRRRKFDKGWEMPPVEVEEENNTTLPGLEQQQQPPSKKKKVTCNFQFTVTWDQFGFYIGLERRAGHPFHANHPKVVIVNNKNKQHKSVSASNNNGSSDCDWGKSEDGVMKTSRAGLRQMFESSCAMADSIGPEAVKKLDESLIEFQAWCMAKKEAAKEGSSVEDKEADADATTTTPTIRALPSVVAGKINNFSGLPTQQPKYMEGGYATIHSYTVHGPPGG